MSATFEARYPGTCTACDGEIKVGDPITFAPFDDVVHVACPPPPRDNPVCPMCFIAHAGGCF